MNVENIKYMQYSFLFLTILSAFFAVFVKEDKKRLISFFLSSIFFIIFTIFLFSGVFAAILGAILLFMFIIFYGYESQEIYFRQGEKIEYNGWIMPNNTLLFAALVICLGLGYAFYDYTLVFFETYKPVEVITLMDYKIVVNEIYSNYFIIIVFIVAALLVSLIWFISILSKEREGEDSCN